MSSKVAAGLTDKTSSRPSKAKAKAKAKAASVLEPGPTQKERMAHRIVGSASPSASRSAGGRREPIPPPTVLSPFRKAMRTNESSDSESSVGASTSLPHKVTCNSSDSPEMDMIDSGDDAVTADRFSTERKTKVKAGSAVRSARVAQIQLNFDVAKLATVQGGDSDAGADSDPDEAHDAYFDKVLMRLELGSLSDSDNDAYVCPDADDEASDVDDEPVRRTGSPSQLSEVQKALAGRKG